MEPIAIQPIGVIHSPFRAVAGAPIQPVYAPDAAGTVRVAEAYAEGLRDLAGFERLWLLYRFDRASAPRLSVVPFRDAVARGVFATRAPCRPNGIGLSCVRLVAVRGLELDILGVDVLDETPLLDIKPYVPAFDAFPGARAGWFDVAAETRTSADARFAPVQPTDSAQPAAPAPLAAGSSRRDREA